MTERVQQERCLTCGGSQESPHLLPFKLETEQPAAEYEPGEWIADVLCDDPFHALPRPKEKEER